MSEPSLTRRRSAPRGELSSDVTRFRGIWAASILAATLALIAVVVASGRDGLSGSPGSLSWLHEQAGLTCASCHEPDRQLRPTACLGCHGPRAHIRPGHAGRAAAGTLACADCHRVHRDHGGVLFAADGTVWRYGPGSKRRLSSSELAGSHFRPATRTAVAVIPAAACRRCHDVDAINDPAAACVLQPHASLGDRRPTTCFDEHRRVAEPGPRVRGARDPAWDAAREVVALVPVPPSAERGSGSPWLWILGSLALALGLWSLVRWSMTVREVRARREAREGTAVAPPHERKLPTINTSTCIGCYACVDACPFDVLDIQDYVAQLARPADCCGLTLCEQRCPNGSLRMGDGRPVTDSPLVRDTLESVDVPGLYLAGDITGLPLIRNAINQGARAVRAIARELAAEKPPRPAKGSPARRERYDLLIVGAGPAGLSAALAAKAAGLSYQVLEQGSVAASIRSFPRGKLVFDQPLELPLIGDLWLEQASKEELLAQWLRIVRREQLAIRQHTRVTGLTPMPIAMRSGGEFAPNFQVSAVEGDDAVPTTFDARRVLVAIGRRGSPRRLPIAVPDDTLARVHYHLADARSLAGQRVLVVGLGDVAMEAALALAKQPGTEVIVSYRGDDFRRGKKATIAEMRRRIAAGSIRLIFSSTVVSIDAERVQLENPAGSVEIACDAIFVLIGSIPPADLLRGFGLRTSDSAEPSAANADAAIP